MLDKEKIQVQHIQVAKSMGKNQIPHGEQSFEEEELQTLWDVGMAEDKAMSEELYIAIWNNEPQFTSHLQLKVARAECELDMREAFCFRKRLWVPNWGPLRTTLIQKTHDSHATGHVVPGPT